MTTHDLNYAYPHPEILPRRSIRPLSCAQGYIAEDSSRSSLISIQTTPTINSRHICAYIQDLQLTRDESQLLSPPLVTHGVSEPSLVPILGLQLLQVTVGLAQHPNRERELEVRVRDRNRPIEHPLDRFLRPRTILHKI